MEPEADKTRILDARDARDALVGDTTVARSATNPTDEAANELVANFRLKRVIGQGPRGVTYLAEQLHPRQVVALKLVRAALAPAEAPQRVEPQRVEPQRVEPQRVEPDRFEPDRFERDAALLAKLNHPGIARLLEADVVHTSAGPRPYFASEYVRGVSPIAHARHARLAPAQRIELLARVCDAVQHAHEHGLVHGDIKMSNLVIADADARPVLLDFGVARVLERPAQQVDPRDDVAALGAVARELLVDGSPPGGALGSTLSRATHPDATRRHPSAAALAADLRRCLARSRVRLGRWLVPTLAILTICLILLLVLYRG